jgi:hypothetical protein
MDRDYPNSGILFREETKQGDRYPDYRGNGEVTCSCGNRISLWLSGWMLQGRKGKFVTLSFKAKESQAQTQQSDDDMGDF